MPYMWLPLAAVLGVTMVVFSLFIAAFSFAFSGLAVLLGQTGWAWLDGAIQAGDGWLGAFMGAALAYLMLPALLPLIAGVFQDWVQGRVEHTQYPHTGSPPSFSLLKEVMQDIKFALKAIVLNIFLFLFMLPLLLTPLGVLVPVLFLLLNGKLLGEELFMAAAGRWQGKQAAAQLARQYRGWLLLYGTGLAFMTTLGFIPFVGLFLAGFTPIVGIILMTHLYHSLDTL